VITSSAALASSHVFVQINVSFPNWILDDTKGTLKCELLT